jgi:hypothetical protein
MDLPHATTAHPDGTETAESTGAQPDDPLPDADAWRRQADPRLDTRDVARLQAAARQSRDRIAQRLTAAGLVPDAGATSVPDLDARRDLDAALDVDVDTLQRIDELHARRMRSASPAGAPARHDRAGRGAPPHRRRLPGRRPTAQPAGALAAPRRRSRPSGVRPPHGVRRPHTRRRLVGAGVPLGAAGAGGGRRRPAGRRARRRGRGPDRGAGDAGGRDRAAGALGQHLAPAHRLQPRLGQLGVQPFPERREGVDPRLRVVRGYGD